MKEITLEINIYDVLIEVSGIYYPEEPEEWYDDNMEGYPGANADFEIESIKAGGVDITALICDEIYQDIANIVIRKQES